jgi:hypothetical protein
MGETALSQDSDSVLMRESLEPYKAQVWRSLTPRERLRRSWKMRNQLPDPRAVHDQKLFPKP